MSSRTLADVTLVERVALVACLFLSVATIGFFMPFVPLFLEASGLTRTQIGQVSGVGTGLAFLVQPFLGRLSDRLDARRPFMFGTALLAASSYLLYPSAHGMVAFVVLSAVSANAISYFGSACAVLVGRLSSGSGKGGALYAKYRAWGSIGYIVFSLIAGWIVQRMGVGRAELGREELKVLFYFGPLIFVAIAFATWFVPDLKASAVVSGAVDVRKRVETPLNMRYFLAAYFFYIFGMFGSAGYLTLYMKSLGASAVWMTNILSVGVVCEVLVMSQVGRLADRYGRRPALTVAFVVLPLRLLLYVLATTPLMVMGVQMLHGLNFGIIGTIGVVFANDMASEENRGVVQARLAACASLATTLAPVICGWFAQRFGFPVMFTMTAVMAGIGSVIFLLFVHETHAPVLSVAERVPLPLRALGRLMDAPLVARMREGAKVGE
jgi:PPP family 3-phenylpropionic acid transporter